ncbi:hypothetical protein SNE40_018373 [Patella caerulea]|uniref:Choice-of-anchor I domain-containing protein n=1 Tax=Patella caerulea TaxID=87958 RepID=A0AAN8J8L3_PATCE
MAMWAVLSLCLMSTCMADIVLQERGYLKLPDRNNNFAVNSGAAKESAYDRMDRFLYVVGKDSAVLHIVDVFDVDNPSVVQTFNFDVALEGYPLDIQVCRGLPNRAYFAVSFGVNDPTRQGHVILYNPYRRGDTALNPINPVDPLLSVGSNPDNIKFTSDCAKLVVSNEGIPAVINNEFIDPPGTVSIISIPETGNPSISTVDFKSYDDPAETIRLLALGVRYMVRVNPTTNSQNPFSNNIEPEYIAISPNNGYAYITLQENNAIARIDLEQNALVSTYPMGYKEYLYSTLDASDQDQFPGVHMTRRNVRGLYQPDKITFMEWGGTLYLITADEGKPYNVPSLGISDNDRARTLESDFSVDSALLAELLDNAQLGRAYISTMDRTSLTDPISEVYTFGGRGFSVFNANTLIREWESGDLIEKVSRWFYPDVFNGGYTGPNLTPTGERDSRSPYMGPELNSVATTTYQGRQLMIFGSGTNGQIYVFQLQASVTQRVDPEFESVHRRGATDATWANLYSREEMGDIGISDLVVIEEADSPIGGSPILIALSEQSGSVSIYSFKDEQYPTDGCVAPTSLRSVGPGMNHHNRTRPAL